MTCAAVAPPWGVAWTRFEDRHYCDRHYAELFEDYEPVSGSRVGVVSDPFSIEYRVTGVRGHVLTLFDFASDRYRTVSKYDTYPIDAELSTCC